MITADDAQHHAKWPSITINKVYNYKSVTIQINHVFKLKWTSSSKIEIDDNYIFSILINFIYASEAQYIISV